MLIDCVNELDKNTLISDELFQELFDALDVIDRERKFIELSDRAKVLGCKESFTKLYKAYQKKIKEDSNSFDNYTNFSFPEDKNYSNLCCGCWIANDEEIYTNTLFGRKTACSHPILPIQILINAETKICKVKLAYKLRNKWNEICVDKELLASSNKIIELAKYGIRVTSENSKALVQYLSDIESLNEYEIPEQISTSHLGWINDEFMPYGNNIVFDNEQNLRTLFDSINEPSGDKELWYSTIKKLRKEGRFEFLIYLIGSLASPLIEIVNGLPFVLLIWGTTGRGKTVNMMLATSVWANPGESKYISGANATPTASEVKMSFLKNLPFMIDDIAQIRDKFKGDYSSLVMDWCTGHSKDRGTKSGGLRESSSWSCCIITNAEQSMVSLNMKGGAVNRIIEVPIAETEIFKDGNGLSNFALKNYGWCGREWIKIINQVGHDRIKELQKKYFNEILDKTKGTDDEKEEKQILPMSIMLATDELAEEYLFKDGVRLDLDECIGYLKNKSEVNENERTYQYIMDEIVRNDIKFVHTSDEHDKTIQDRWGLIDDVEHKAIIINTIFNEILSKQGFSSKSFLIWASKQGLIDYSNDKKHPYMKQRTIRGTRVWCVWLKLQSDEETSGFEDADGCDELPFD